MPDPVILIDVLNLAMRNHFAHQHLSCEGRPTGVLYGCLKTIRDLQDKVSRRLLVAWDNGVPVPGAERPRNWRDDIIATYKANRKRDDSVWTQVVQQLPILYQCLNWLGYTSVSVMGLEADDIISLLAATSKDEFLIFSTDKDFYQCITEDDRVRILVPKKDKNGFKVITASDVLRDHGIPVNRWAEYLALGGDSCDNIKPMRGMGPKTAIKLIKSGVDIRNHSKTNFIQDLPDKYDRAAPDIIASYEAARLPTKWTDPRIKSCIEKSGMRLPGLMVNSDQSWSTEKHRQECMVAFTGFLAENDMNTLFAVRRQFFAKGEQPCQSPIQKPKPSPKKIRTLI